MTDVVTKLRNYFSLFDGTSKSLVEHRDVIDAVIDDRILFTTSHGEIDHPQYIERIRVLLDIGTKVEILEMKMHELGVEYRIRMMIPGHLEPLEFHSIGVADKGKIIRVQPISYAESYDKFLGSLKEEASPEMVVGA